ncbi:MAG: DUF1552 domain-containing protein [Verrucomicrobiales bacterium]|nr:DUF1552 domain-containing protein [Verrucomicrobiales bacterium]
MNPRSLISSSLDRRRFLRSAAATIALPALESVDAVAGEAEKSPQNFVTIGTWLGWHQDAFYPKEAGQNYTMSPTLAPLESYREDFTIFSGLDHRAPNGHGAWSNFLCGNQPETYSLDQMIADQIGQKSRFPSVELTAGAGEVSKSMSFTKQGTGLPMIQRPSVFYNQLFISKADQKRTEYLLESGRSSLDMVLEDAKRLQTSLPARDRDKLDEYFESFRSVEKRMERQLKSVNDPVPTTDYQLPDYDPITPNLQIEAEAILYDLMVLALETESTRVMSMFLHGLGQVFSFEGNALSAGYHGLSHHGNDPVMIRDLVSIETAHIHCFAGFLKQLKEKKNPQGKSLLDNTVILLGTGMGDASRHSNGNLPTLVAGGGFRHGNHLAIDAKKPDAPLLGDLYVTLMQRLGMETDQFSNANRNMNQLFS